MPSTPISRRGKGVNPSSRKVRPTDSVRPRHSAGSPARPDASQTAPLGTHSPLPQNNSFMVSQSAKPPSCVGCAASWWVPLRLVETPVRSGHLALPSREHSRFVGCIALSDRRIVRAMPLNWF